MPENLIMLDYCLASLAKLRKTLKLEDMLEFFKPWHRVDKYANKIFYCLKINWPLLDFDIVF